MRIKNYKILTAASATDLGFIVTKYLQDGYTLVGQPFMIRALQGTPTKIAQAVTKD